MQDFISKGTGNSRFLKTSLPAGTTWEDALAHLKNGDFPIDLNGINADGITQLGTPLNKANLLSDETAAKLVKYKQLASFAVGDTIKLKVNGTPTDFIVVHQGKPSSMYDDSCDGTWLLMKDCYETRQWNSSNVNSYKDSTIHSYLNSTFLDLFDTNIKNAIKQVKIPYVNGTGGSAVASGSNGLSTKVFLLSGYELGWTTSDNAYFHPADGTKLDYFFLNANAGTTDANNRRIAYLNGSASYWWSRSPHNSSVKSAWQVAVGGNYINTVCSSSSGVRPALVLPSAKYYDVIDCKVGYYAPPQTPNEALNKLADFLNVADGEIVDLQTAVENIRVLSGTYTGTGTGSPTNPTKLILPFRPKYFCVSAVASSFCYIFTMSAIPDTNYARPGGSVFFSSSPYCYQMYETIWSESTHTLSWLSNQSSAAAYGMGLSGVLYNWFAVG